MASDSGGCRVGQLRTVLSERSQHVCSRRVAWSTRAATARPLNLCPSWLAQTGKACRQPCLHLPDLQSFLMSYA